MTTDTQHCWRCGRSFDAPDVNRSHTDEDACTDCVTIQRHTMPVSADEPEPETTAREIL